MPGQSINLIPDQEKHEQTKSQFVKVSTVFAIILLIIVGGITAYYYFQTLAIKSKISGHDKNINSLRNEIKSQSQIEIVARNLDSKYKVLKTILSQRNYYSRLLKEFEVRRPSEIQIDDFTLATGNLVNVTGTSDTYLTIAKFVNSLAASDFVGGAAGMEKAFTQVSLNTVTTETNSNKVKFFIVVTYDPNVLKEL